MLGSNESYVALCRKQLCIPVIYITVFSFSTESEIDLILMDIMMLVMDGLTATRIIGAIPRKFATKVFFFRHI